MTQPSDGQRRQEMLLDLDALQYDLRCWGACSDVEKYMDRLIEILKKGL